MKDIQFVKGRHYVFEAHVKLLNDNPEKLWQTLKASVSMTLPEHGK